MNHWVLKNAIVYTPHGSIKHGSVHIQGSSIVQVDDDCASSYAAQERVIDAHGYALLPGFIDMHIHGSGAAGVMDAREESLQAIARSCAAQGVTSFLAALMTESPERMNNALQAIFHTRGPIPLGATLLGAYMEGPYLSAHAKGAHDAAHIRCAQQGEYEEWFKSGAVLCITIAPEYPENMALIELCQHYGVIPCVGHTNASYDLIQEAINKGARQATHTFNAMTGLHHRMPGAVGAVLTNDAIICELIADGIHVHPAALALAVRAKGVDKIVLVTDAQGMCGALHRVDNAIYTPDGVLAGSLLTMNNALRNIIQATGLSLENAWPMTSLNAARQLGLDHVKGIIAQGYDADLVLIDPHDFSVKMTIVAGQIVYSALD